MSKETWRFVRDKIVEHLKGKAVKLALRKLLGSPLAVGFKGWLVSFVAEELFEEVAEPLIKFVVRKGFLIYDKVDGKLKVKKIKKAKEGQDEETYISTIGNV